MSSGNTTLLCRRLYTNPPSCDRTYAESLGSKYEIAHLAFITVTTVTSLYCLFHTVQLFRKKGFSSPISVQWRLFILCDVVCCTLIVRAYDPFGWQDQTPATVVWLAYDIGTSCIYSICFSIVYEWIRITLYWTPGYKGHISLVKNVILALNGVVWVSFLTFSVLQRNVDPQWLWHAIKLSLGAVVLLCLLALQAIFGLRIWSTLAENEKRSLKYEDQAARIRDRHLKAAIEAGKAGADASAVIKQGMANKSETKKRGRVRRILGFLFYTAIGETVVMLFQVVFVLGALSDRPTDEEPLPPPSSTFDIFIEAVFDIAHAAAALLVVTYHSFKRDHAKDKKKRLQQHHAEMIHERRTSQAAQRKGHRYSYAARQVRVSVSEEVADDTLSAGMDTTDDSKPPAPPEDPPSFSDSMDWSTSGSDDDGTYADHTLPPLPEEVDRDLERAHEVARASGIPLAETEFGTLSVVDRRNAQQGLMHPQDASLSRSFAPKGKTSSQEELSASSP